MDLNNLRQEYSRDPIDVETVDPSPFKQFEGWFQQASDLQVVEPNAMVLSTVDPTGQPTQRTVLLKLFDESGFVFFTNYNSRKAIHIEANSKVALLFPWYVLQRQVEVNGEVERINAADSLKYFALRPRGSQLGAWVSQQSTVISTRSLLKAKLAELTQKFATESVPMPPNWGGFRVKPTRFEFWQGGPNRLHDRIEYSCNAEDQVWHRQRLSP